MTNKDFPAEEAHWLLKEIAEQKAEIERLRATLLWIASMADEDNEWDAVERFRTARQKAIDAVEGGK